MKNLTLLTLFLSCCFLANGQDYLKEADACFEKGDYECAKRNYTLFQTFDGADMSAQIKNADECLRALFAADDYFKEKDFSKAGDRYKTVLDKNPKDQYAKKQYDFCFMQFISSTPIIQTSQNLPKSSSFADYTETYANLNIAMVFVEGGTFIMGCTSEQGDDCKDNEKPAHQVTLSNYYMGKY